MLKRISYVKTCPICGTEFITYDSRVITDKEECNSKRHNQESRARYQKQKRGELDTPNWRKSNNPSIRKICAKILTALPSSRLNLDRLLVFWLEHDSELKAGENTLPACLTRLKLMKQIAYDPTHKIWIRVHKSRLSTGKKES
jgi:hypothetical protein